MTPTSFSDARNMVMVHSEPLVKRISKVTTAMIRPAKATANPTATSIVSVRHIPLPSPADVVVISLGRPVEVTAIVIDVFDETRTDTCDSEGIAKRGLNPRLRGRQEPTAGSLTPYGPFSSATTASPPIIATSTITPALDFPDRRAMSSSIWSWQETEVSWSQLTTVGPRMSGEGDTWSTTDTYLFHGTRTFNCGDFFLSHGCITAPTPTTLQTVANRSTA